MVKPFSFPGLRIVEVTEKQIQQAGGRLDAGCFFSGFSGDQQWATQPLAGHGGLTISGHRPRFKRPYVDFDGLPFYQPSQICEVNPEPARLLAKSSKTEMAPLCVKAGQVLLTCSGTIGDAALVGKTLDGAIFSHDLIRMDVSDSSPVGPGYIYAFLKTKRGKQAVVSHSYGAVIQHIEPEHLASVDVPIAEAPIADSINEAILKSFELRDESNDLLALARKKLLDSLALPPIDDLRKKRAGEFDQSVGVVNFEATLGDRMDASHYVPIATTIEQLLPKHAPVVTTIGDARISGKIILPGQFKRIYVEEGFGVPFIGGGEIGNLDPRTGKNLSWKEHKARIEKELTIKENQVLLTCSGTIGRCNIAPKHWDGWAASQHMIRIQPVSPTMAGYIYAWLSTEYGRELVRRFTYGAVIDEIDADHVSRVAIPLINESALLEIGSLVLEASEKLYQAFLLEEQAVKDFDTKIWGT